AGEPFLAYMQREVFDPLGLRSIVAEHTDSIIAHRASFYERDRETSRVLNAPYVDNSYKWAGGGFISNTEDLVRFGWAHLDGGFLRPATVEALFTPLRTTSGEVTNYGLGWSSGTDSAGRRWVGHTGGSVGARAVLLVYPDHRVVVAALANLGTAPMSPEFAGRLAAPLTPGTQRRSALSAPRRPPASVGWASSRRCMLLPRLRAAGGPVARPQRGIGSAPVLRAAQRRPQQRRTGLLEPLRRAVGPGRESTDAA